MISRGLMKRVKITKLMLVQNVPALVSVMPSQENVSAHLVLKVERVSDVRENYSNNNFYSFLFCF